MSTEAQEEKSLDSFMPPHDVCQDVLGESCCDFFVCHRGIAWLSLDNDLCTFMFGWDVFKFLIFHCETLLCQKFLHGKFFKKATDDNAGQN